MKLRGVVIDSAGAVLHTEVLCIDVARAGIGTLDKATTEQFVQHLTDCQDRLYALIRSLMLDADAARDVLQETNLVLWRKSDEFAPGSDFGAWACRVARFQVLAWARDRGRDRMVFDQELLGDLAEAAERQYANGTERRRALRQCLGKLTAEQRQMIQLRYEGSTVKAVAEVVGKKANHVAQLLFRIRAALAQCIESTLEGRES